MNKPARYCFGLIGHPLTHSLSPLLHQAALQSIGQVGSYQLWDIHPDQFDQQFPEKLAAMRAGEIYGLNITIPYKQRSLRYLDRLTPECQGIGAVNTIYLESGILTGDNTDARGFLCSLDRLSIQSEKTTALVFGSGGAARAVIYSLVRRSWFVICASRNLESVKSMLNDFRSITGPGQLCITGITAADIEPFLSQLSLIVNATPLGMYPSLETSPWPLELTFPSQATCLDLVYNPAVTRLLRTAQEAGAKSENGAWMLVEQAAAAFEHWTGENPSRERMILAFEQHFSRTQ